MPDVRMAQTVRVRIAGVDAVQDIFRQTPKALLASDFGNGQLNDRGVAEVITVLSPDDQRQVIPRFHRDRGQLCCVGRSRNGLGTTGINHPARQHLLARFRLVHDEPLDTVPAGRVSHGRAAFDTHSSLDRASPANRHVAIGHRVHGHAAGGHFQVLVPSCFGAGVDTEPRDAVGRPAANFGNTGQLINLLAQSLLR